MKIIKNGESCCVKSENSMLALEQGHGGKRFTIEQINIEQIQKFKRMAHAFVKQDYFNTPQHERGRMNLQRLSQMVSTRYEKILEEYCKYGKVESSKYEFFDTPDSPVPIFGAELDALLKSMRYSGAKDDIAGPKSVHNEDLTMEVRSDILGQ